MARDRYVEALTEKIWERIPPIYRHHDGLSESAGGSAQGRIFSVDGSFSDAPALPEQGAPRSVLRGLVEVLAVQAAHLRRSQDRLWEDHTIETCDDWAIPYIADLVATRLVSVLTASEQRADVAKTIYYRRRAGTRRVLEELIADISRWEGTLVEGYDRLVRCPHRLDPALAGRAGRLSGTPPHGLPDIRRVIGAQTVDGPFSEFHHHPDMRRPKGLLGQHGISKVVFHLARLEAWSLEDVTPAVVTDGPDTAHCFDPSGRDIQLFATRDRPASYDDWRPALEWELPLPVRCRVLGHVELTLTAAILDDLVTGVGLSAAARTELEPLIGLAWRSEAAFVRHVSSLANAGPELLNAGGELRYRQLIREATTADSGARVLLPQAISLYEAGVGDLPFERCASGSLPAGATPTPWSRDAVIDPERGRWHPVGPLTIESVGYNHVAPARVGAGPWPRPDLPAPDATYPPESAPLLSGGANNDRIVELSDSRTWTGVSNKLAIRAMQVQAADGARPYVVLEANLRLRASPAGTTDLDGNPIDSTLVLSGLWFGADDTHNIRLEGDFEHVRLSHCTLDPGGEDALGNPIHRVNLVVRGHIELLEIDHCILHRVRTAGSGVIEKLRITDSIIAPRAGHAILQDLGETHIERCTVAGPIDVHRLWATDSLLTDIVTVEDNQTGCVRFSAVIDGGVLPRTYETFRFEDDSSLFVSRRFGDAAYFQLSDAAPEGVLTGAESGSDVGFTSENRGPLREAGLAAKVDEYLPFGMIPHFAHET